jgi:ribosome-associated protein
MREPLVIRSGLAIPPEALSVQFSRSSGPGGQNVNKVASKAEVRLDPSLVPALSAEVRGRLLYLAGRRRDADGRVVLVSQRTRDQGRNLEDALSRLKALVLRALERPRRRALSVPTAGSQERRLRKKKVRSAVKRERALLPGED